MFVVCFMSKAAYLIMTDNFFSGGRPPLWRFMASISLAPNVKMLQSPLDRNGGGNHVLGLDHFTLGGGAICSGTWERLTPCAALSSPLIKGVEYPKAYLPN